MTKHKHEWVLIDTYDDSKRPAPKSHLPKGQWVTTGGIFGSAFYSGPSVREINQDINRMVVESIQRSDEPRYSSETWACNCGKHKTNSRTEPSLNELILGKRILDKENN